MCSVSDTDSRGGVLLISCGEYQGHEHLCVCPQPFVPFDAVCWQPQQSYSLLASGWSLMVAAPALCRCVNISISVGHPCTDNRLKQELKLHLSFKRNWEGLNLMPIFLAPMEVQVRICLKCD